MLEASGPSPDAQARPPDSAERLTGAASTRLARAVPTLIMPRPTEARPRVTGPGRRGAWLLSSRSMRSVSISRSSSCCWIRVPRKVAFTGFLLVFGSFEGDSDAVALVVLGGDEDRAGQALVEGVPDAGEAVDRQAGDLVERHAPERERDPEIDDLAAGLRDLEAEHAGAIAGPGARPVGTRGGCRALDRVRGFVEGGSSRLERVDHRRGLLGGQAPFGDEPEDPVERG